MIPLSRDLTSPWESRSVRDLLQALLLAELLDPSTELWLLSAWISDVEVIDNGARAFSGVRPDWPAAPLRLSDFVRAFVALGGRMAIVIRDVGHNAVFLSRLREIQAQGNGRLGVALAANAHEKALVGNDYVLAGSMNMTPSGLSHNEEHLLLRVDRAVAAQRRLSLMERWKDQISWG